MYAVLLFIFVLFTTIGWKLISVVHLSVFIRIPSLTRNMYLQVRGMGMIHYTNYKQNNAFTYQISRQHYGHNALLQNHQARQPKVCPWLHTYWCHVSLFSRISSKVLMQAELFHDETITMVYTHSFAGKRPTKLEYKYTIITIHILQWLEYKSPFVALDMEYRTWVILLVVLIIGGIAEM